MKELLQHPSLYLLVQSLLGAKRARRLCIEQYARPLPGERVLDVGCGPGFVVDYLPQVDFVGVDIDRRYIRYAQRRYKGRGRFHCIQLSESTVEHFGHFDLIMLNGVLHHLSDDHAQRLLGLLSRCLAPGGRVMTLDAGYHEGMSPLSRWLLRHDRGQYVRPATSYSRLARRVFPAVETDLREDLLFIPYSVVVMVCRRRAQGIPAATRAA